MPAKRGSSHEDECDHVKGERDVSPPSTPKQPNKKARVTASPAGSNTSSASAGGSPKAIFGAMIVEAGIKSLSKSDAQAATGLTSAQQIEMLKKNRGSLRKALMAAVSTL